MSVSTTIYGPSLQSTGKRRNKRKGARWNERAFVGWRPFLTALFLIVLYHARAFAWQWFVAIVVPFGTEGPCHPQLQLLNAQEKMVTGQPLVLIMSRAILVLDK